MKISHLSWIGTALGSWLALVAQAADAPAPVQQQPAARPDTSRDLEPAVNTSAPSAAAIPSRATAPAPVAAEKPAAAATKSAASAGPAPAATPPGARTGRVMDRLNLDATQVTGNSELPKVLYIVPWKRADLGDLNGRPMNSLLDEVLSPIDRDVFVRENRYYDALEAGQAPPRSQGTRDER